MNFFNMFAAWTFILTIFIGSVYTANHGAHKAFHKEKKGSRVHKRHPNSAHRFAFAEDEKEKDGTAALACCPCGGHHCCGSMCHG